MAGRRERRHGPPHAPPPGPQALHFLFLSFPKYYRGRHEQDTELGKRRGHIWNVRGHTEGPNSLEGCQVKGGQLEQIPLSQSRDFPDEGSKGHKDSAEATAWARAETQETAQHLHRQLPAFRWGWEARSKEGGEQVRQNPEYGVLPCVSSFPEHWASLATRPRGRATAHGQAWLVAWDSAFAQSKDWTTRGRQASHQATGSWGVTRRSSCKGSWSRGGGGGRRILWLHLHCEKCHLSVTCSWQKQQMGKKQ